MARKRDRHNPRDDERRQAEGADERADDQRDPAGEDSPESDADALRADLAEAEDRYKRALADFQNYQRRAVANEARAREEGAAGVVKSVLPVLDHFDLALGHDPEQASAASILEGVKLIKGELLRTLAQHGVSPIEPDPGDELDHHRHEAVGQMSAEELDPGAVAACVQTGYRVGERVLRPAKVMVVAPEAPSENAPQAGDGDDANNDQNDENDNAHAAPDARDAS